MSKKELMVILINFLAFIGAMFLLNGLEVVFNIPSIMAILIVVISIRFVYPNIKDRVISVFGISTLLTVIALVTIVVNLEDNSNLLYQFAIAMMFIFYGLISIIYFLKPIEILKLNNLEDKREVEFDKKSFIAKVAISLTLLFFMIVDGFGVGLSAYIDFPSAILVITVILSSLLIQSKQKRFLLIQNYLFGINYIAFIFVVINFLIYPNINPSYVAFLILLNIYVLYIYYLWIKPKIVGSILKEYLFLIYSILMLSSSIFMIKVS